ncbi:hypothetical protein PIB30_044249, partial [Stylosanthes scabra]|nr:hypothetical protein [Stylosanthes scabra]
CEMAENLPGGQGAVVQEVAVAQMPRELPTIYHWITRDVLGSPPILDKKYLDEIKLTGVIFGGGELERRYRVEAARPGDRVCYLNLDHPTVPNWLWVNEVMFTEFGLGFPDFVVEESKPARRVTVGSSTERCHRSKEIEKDCRIIKSGRPWVEISCIPMIATGPSLEGLSLKGN